MGPAAAGERRYQLLDGTEQHHRRCQLCHGDPTGHPELPGCTLTEAQTESLDLTGFPKLRSLDISGIAAWQQLPQLPEERIRLLDISHTAVTDIRTLTEASYHDLILSYQATMDWETLGACNTYQFTVLDCPLDRQERRLRCGGLEVDTAAGTVWQEGQEVPLTELEYRIVLLLASYPNKIFSAENLYESIWEEPYFYSCKNTVMVHIRNIRQKVGSGAICTVWGKGYRMGPSKP